jgi:hypothetical protein
MIRAQMGTHNTSENGAVHGTPCTCQPITVTSNKHFFLLVVFAAGEFWLTKGLVSRSGWPRRIRSGSAAA